MRIGLVTSAVGHGVVLLWSIVSFAGKPYVINSMDMPVDLITVSEFSQLTKGVKTAEKVTVPKPMAEKVADPTPPKEEAPPKVVEKKQEIAAAAEAPPPPKQVEPKPTPPEKKAEPDPAAEALEALKKNEPKKTEPPKPEPPKQQAETPPVKKPPPPKPTPRFDPIKTAALLDKRDPRRQSITGQEINATPSLGLPGGAAATLSANEIDALRARIESCWIMPLGVDDAQNIRIAIRMVLHQNGTLSAEPTLLNRGAHPLFQVAAESLMRAIRQCQPYKLPIAKYDVWRDLEIVFDPPNKAR